MGVRHEDDIEHTWKCGNCHFRVYYLTDETPPEVCPNCKYLIGERDVLDVPDEVRKRIHR